MTLRILGSLGVESRLLVNSVGCPKCRPAYMELLRAELRQIGDRLCDDCRRRTETNPLRVLDCKVESCQPLINSLPMITDHLCSECADHFRQFRAYLDKASIPFEVLPRLVRGLDYYVRTAFEIVSGDLGSQNALAGGGRYDGLSEVLGGPPAQGFGFAMGLDRLVMILPENVSARAERHPLVFIAYVGDAAFERALTVARVLRSEGVACHLEIGAGSLKSQMRLANKLKAANVLIIGDEELARDKYPIRRMADSFQWEASLPELTAYVTAGQSR
jgi:histidyl-tRNA synthetase